MIAGEQGYLDFIEGISQGNEDKTEDLDNEDLDCDSSGLAPTEDIDFGKL